jgi:amidase
VPTQPSDFVWDTLQVTGGMGRTAEDVALMLQAVAGPSRWAPLAQPIEGRDFVGAARAGMRRGARIAWVADIAGIGVDAAIAAVCRDAALELRQAGAQVDEIAFDLSEARKAFLALRGHWMVAHQYTRLERADEFGVNVANNVRLGLETTTRDLAAAEEVRGRMWHRFRELFERYDALLTPCMAVPPFPVDRNYPETIAGRPMETYIDWIAPTFVLSMTGLPVASVPCGLDGEGLPVGLQVVGPPRGEEVALALAATIQQARPIGLPPI